jgi:hypothetical protein
MLGCWQIKPCRQFSAVLELLVPCLSVRSETRCSSAPFFLVHAHAVINAGQRPCAPTIFRPILFPEVDLIAVEHSSRPLNCESRVACVHARRRIETREGAQILAGLLGAFRDSVWVRTRVECVHGALIHGHVRRI